jgi:predicted negative regulator of RcsB-dependent stress response
VSDYLTDEEQLDKLKGWWEKNGMAVLGAVVVAVGGVIGWNYYDSHRSDQIAGASELYADYLTAEGTERETVAGTLASRYPDSTYRAFVLLRDAEAAVSAEDLPAATAALNEALALTGDEHLADLIRLRLARVQQQQEQSEAALATLGQVTSLGLRSRVQELKGDIHMARGEREQAHESYAAALEEAGEGAQLDLLRLKVADTADAGGA